MSRESRNKPLTCAVIDSMPLPRHPAFATFAKSGSPAWGTGGEFFGDLESIEGKKRRSFDKAGVSEVPMRDEGGRRALEGLYEMEGEKGDEVAMCTEE